MSNLTVRLAADFIAYAWDFMHEPRFVLIAMATLIALPARWPLPTAFHLPQLSECMLLRLLADARSLKASGTSLSELRLRLEQAFGKGSHVNIDSLLEEVLECVEDKSKVRCLHPIFSSALTIQCVVYTLGDSYFMGLDGAILEAVMQARHLGLAKVLHHAVVWRRLDIARSTLADRRCDGHTLQVSWALVGWRCCAWAALR